MTAKEFAKRCGVKVRTVRFWISIGKIKCKKGGGNDKRAYDIPESELEKLTQK